MMQNGIVYEGHKTFEEPMYVGLKISDLKVGDVITENRLHELHKLNSVPDIETKFWAFVMRLRQDIINYNFKAGHPVVVRQKRNDFHIIQGTEMSEYCFNRTENAVKQMMRNSLLMDHVDTEDMDRKELDNHERRTHVVGEQTRAVLSARNKLGMNQGNIVASLQVSYNDDEDDLPDM